MKQKLKIGILLNQPRVVSSLKELITDLCNNQDFEVILLQNNFVKQSKYQKIFSVLKSRQISKKINVYVFYLINKIEHFFLSAFDKNYKSNSINMKIDLRIFTKVVNINPIFFKKFYVKYSKEEIDKIDNENLDFIFNANASGIFSGRILTVSKFGLLSFHHGDNSWNRGGPPGFWEVFLKKRKSGFIIQICTKKLDDGIVLFKGEIPTKGTYLQNRNNLNLVSYQYLEKIFEYVYANKKLPKEIIIDTSKSKLYTTPNLKNAIKYFMLLGFKFLANSLRKKIFQSTVVWNIAYSKRNWKELDIEELKTVENPEGRFFADPFLISEDSMQHIFVEDYCLNQRKGSISCISISKSGKQITKKIIEENFHLSFPFIFKYENNYYMVPESLEDKSIRLYKCKNFPYEWEYSHNLIENINAVDSIIFYKNSQWWLLTNTCYDKSKDYNSRMHIFFSDSPLSKNWIEHKKNPVIFNSDFARNGGLIFEEDKIYRVCQKYGFKKYGEEIFIREIVKIDNEDFEEKPISSISPDSSKRYDCIHHLSSNKEFSVIDFVSKKKGNDYGI